MSFKVTREILSNLFTHDLAQRRVNRYQLHNADQIRKALISNGVFHPDNPIADMGCTPMNVDFENIAGCQPFEDIDTIHPITFTNANVMEIMDGIVPNVVQLMREFPGKVYIAGGSLYAIFLQRHLSWGSDIDVFFCASSAEEAEKILARGMNLLESSFLSKEIKLEPEISPMVCSFFDRSADHVFKKVQFIRRLYPEGRPDMIIGAFDLHPCQIFWSLETGIQCTTAALFSMITRSFPLDLSRRSLSFGKRLQKYKDEKFCTILLPGVKTHDPVENFGRVDKGESFLRIDETLYSMTIAFHGPMADYFDYQTPEETEEPENYRNLSVVLRQGSNLVFKLPSYADFCNNTDIENALFGESITFKKAQKMLPKSAQNKFKDQKDYKDFANALYVEDDKQTAERIWEENKEKLLGYLRPLFCGKVRPSHYWKIDDPGAQGFGQNFPRPISPTEYYGGPEHYHVMRVGLLDSSCWAIRQLCKLYRCPNDIFRLLCSMTLQAEGALALNNLKIL
jgi:hypothetical protein